VAAPAAQSGDRLLWLAALVVAAMGLGWLLIEAPWSAGDGLEAVVGVTPDTGNATVVARSQLPPADPPAARDPLYLARLALEAGMLIEPAEYSAWTLFCEALDGDPHNPEARDGLAEVATALLGRGRTAFEQGRLDDAASIAGTIVSRLPEHAGALALAADIEVARRPPPVVEQRRPERAAAIEPPPPSPVERIPELHAEFLEAMGRNAVLTPAGTSARDLVGAMIELAPGHELTVAARELLVTELLDRSAQALEALDTAAAQTWIDSAVPLASDAAQVERAQQRLTRHLIDTESRKRLPVSALSQTVRVAPEYPATAINRDIEGWVDVEFVVTPEGETGDITVVAASHERYFRGEAVAAVEQWRFEPVIFMGQPIPQHAYTRLEFVLD
jgi:TonB family protein